jgi:penicillin-binding protein 1C
VAGQWLDGHWRKDQILEAYLNLVPFRGELVGIDALSRTLFGKVAGGLDEREAALAAALIRSPNARPALAARRACEVLQAMNAAQAAADCPGLETWALVALQRKAFDPSEGIAPHVASRLLAVSPRPQASLRSTLRAPLQRVSQESLQRHLRELKGRHVQDGAVVVLDNARGEVLAWVGSSGDLSNAPDVDGVTAHRQAGSTLKPFLYAQAIAEQRLTAASLLEDSPAQIATLNGLYIPQNYDHQFKGWVSVRTALAASLNVPAVRTLVMVSPTTLHRQLRAAGLPLRETGDYFGYSLALGSAEVPLLGLANAYRTLANGGRYSPVSLTPVNKVEFKAALEPRACFIVADILSDTNARARTFGTDSILATRFWSAVKTGTSKDMRDNWAVGFSQRYTVGVWVGNADGQPMWDVSGVSGAAPVWADVMNFLHREEASRAPAPPAGLVQSPTRFGGDLEAPRHEWFVQGTQQSSFALNTPADRPHGDHAGNASGGRIIAPTSGTVIALDPDIPPARQRLSFSAQGQELTWLMDGRRFARGTQAQWMPWPGRHLVQLVNAAGLILDEVHIEVRGAGVKTAAAGSPPAR